MPRLGTLVPAPLRPLARKVRGYFRSLEAVSLNHPLSPADCRAAIEPAELTVLVERNTTFPCRVRVRNLGGVAWSSFGTHPLSLTFRWLSPRKEPIDAPVTRVPFPSAVYPGEAVEATADLTAPDFLGHYLVEVDLAQEGGPSFREFAPRPTLIEVQVTGRAAEDIDYYKAYATADLTRDYWTVVGPDNKELFDRLGKAKLDTLVQNGLTPDGRVLDVGCGTGQLAIPMEGYLSDRGLYIGTDIGREAIEFCRARFQRPNVRFVQNEMTAVPIDGMAFDFVTFFSVFTHTYPDETVLLLAEAKRLLAPGGKVIGDVFTSPMVERCAGNRGAVELNRDHFLRLVKLAGLRAEVFASWPWQKYATRELFVFTHPTG